MPWNVGLPPAEWYELGDRRLEPIINEVLDLDEVALDTETTGLNIITDIPLFWSLSWGERRIGMPTSTLSLFREAFTDPTKRWIFAGAKFDTHMLANNGIQIAGELMDIPVMHSLLYEEDSHELKYMEKQLLGWRTLGFKELFAPKAGETVGDRLLRAYHGGELNKLCEYVTDDSYGTSKCKEVLQRELEREQTWSLYPDEYPNLWHLFFKVEMPFTKVLWKCERQGIKINKQYLEGLRGPIREEIDRIKRKINHIAGRIINPSSNDQMRDFFYGKLKIKPRTYTKGGKRGVRQPSVDATMLEWIADHEEGEGKETAELTIRLRDLEKTDSTYLVGMVNRADRRSRIHSKFNQDVARTGRLSSTNPNVQNIKTVEEDEWNVREGFVAEDDCDLIVSDYDQLEMRLLAAAAGEPAMIDTFKRNRDIHMSNAVFIFGPQYEKKHSWSMKYEDVEAAKSIEKKTKSGELPPEAITERVKLALLARLRVKTIGYGLNYGMKENKLARSLGCTKEEAKEFIKLYLERLPAVSKFYAETIEDTEALGFSYTILGRRRFHPEILSHNKLEKWSAERKAVNNGIQGTAADLVKLAMILCDREKLDERYGAHMELQVHDELVFECPKATTREALPIIQELMEHPLPHDLAVPLKVSIGKGPDWMHAK